MKKKNIFLAIMMILVLAFGSTMTVSAQELPVDGMNPIQITADGTLRDAGFFANFRGIQCFDANYYAANNPGVVAQVGNSKEALFNHYCTVGWKTGAKAEFNPKMVGTEQRVYKWMSQFNNYATPREKVRAFSYFCRDNIPYAPSALRTLIYDSFIYDTTGGRLREKGLNCEGFCNLATIFGNATGIPVATGYPTANHMRSWFFIDGEWILCDLTGMVID